MKPLLLIAEDTETNIDLLVEVLGNDYEINIALDGKAALESIDQVLPDLILLDIMMPKMDGYQVCMELKENSRTKLIPIIFLTALTDEHNESKGLEMGAVDYITKPFNPFLVKTRVKNHLLLKKYQDQLEELLQQQTYQLIKTQEATIKSMATLAEYRDPETGGHIKRTQSYVKQLAVTLQRDREYSPELTDDVIQDLYRSAPLHDIGKVGVPDHILLKPGKLTDEESKRMRLHALYGRNAIRVSEKELGDTSTFLSYAREIAYTHHERWDGQGYPKGLKQRDIPLPGRIMALADVYDALISRRVYKAPFSHHDAVTIISEGRGTHFDPTIFDAFIDIQEQFRQIAIDFSDSDEEKRILENDII